MVKLDYLCELFENQLPHIYTLLQSDASEMFYICAGDHLVGTINRVKDGWQQINGWQMSNELIEDIGKFIEQQALLKSCDDQISRLKNQVG